MRRWIVTALALLAGAATTGFLLWYGSPGREAVQVYVLARDVPAGSLLGPDSLRLAPVRVPSGARPPLGPDSERLLRSEPAAHDLQAGQLLQAADLSPAAAPGGDRRLVLVPLHDAPPLAPGDRIDLLLVSGGERSAVVPFVLGLEVRAVTAGGVVVSATSRAASGLVYAGATARLVAVAADHSSRPGQEAAVSSMEDAVAAVRQ